MRRRLRASLWLIVFVALCSPLWPASVNGQQPSARDFSREQARTSRAWVRDGVIYEIFPRAFSPTGNFEGITARLDGLKSLGVTILWLMPIHEIGQ